MIEDRTDRTIRAAASVDAAVDFFTEDDRYARHLAVHHPDGALCGFCGKSWPCPVTPLALAARDRVEDTRRAITEQAPERPAEGWATPPRWLGPATRPRGATGPAGGVA
ncbi:MAG: hypothetical protein AVDCRST_MAG68-5146 [uncultured Gemmatimonadetes bacterium]|uniref:Uncharacterized protein n=1 Tax=uncultured Gemmatimonadota bacterium TaxID=203437 RepID=A0A6J4MS65_9BACT|nr:MAG: hypothetical protein AVDCRST_MAG68-5146 [uncultured Gemmatimonadota bacterium]